ncbi:MAG TPA: arginine--tRNA ligase [Thermoanaerobaculia bacterium]|nr:arginine--tRNA ligase [Thermoanaerobaculia bacterium]
MSGENSGLAPAPDIGMSGHKWQNAQPRRDSLVERLSPEPEEPMILDELTSRLTELLRSRVLSLFGHAVERVILQTPPRLVMGDLATPLALELAKALKKPPRVIAQTLIEGIELPPLVSSASVEGAGYINFKFDRLAFTVTLLRRIDERPPSSGDRILVEHTNINPNKAAHIGHLRNAVLGDTLVRLLQWLGHTVETQNYIDDTGVQVADVVVGFERLLGVDAAGVEKQIEDQSVPFDYFCWDLYSRMTEYYEANPEARQWQRDSLHQIERQEGQTAAIARQISRAIVERHTATMLRLGIRYDVLTKESDILTLRFWDHAFELLKTSGSVIYETSGKHKDCWVMKLADAEEFEGLEEPDKILVRSNGTVTYVGKDIAYQLWKFGLLERTFEYQRFLTYQEGKPLWESVSDGGDPAAPSFGGAQRVYNVIDVRQAYLQKVVKEGLRLLGHPEAAERSIHFSYEMVALTPSTAVALGMNVNADDMARPYLEMSGRKGLGVKADDLMNALEEKAAAALSANARDSDGEGDQRDSAFLARQISIGALRYFMLKYGRNKVIAFDFNEALTFEGDSGPYLQYSAVRAQNIFRKMALQGIDSRLGTDELDSLTLGGEMADEMWEIVLASAGTVGAVRRAVEALELSFVSHHALELAQKFNSFYHKFPILKEKDPAERQRRAACAEIFRRTSMNLLGLMGVPLPDRM